MDDKIKELAIKAGAQYFQHADYWMTTDLNIHRFAELVREDERRRLNGVTAHEQMLMDGQQSLLKGRK